MVESFGAFTDEFMAVLFLPHMDMDAFPGVQKVLAGESAEG